MTASPATAASRGALEVQGAPVRECADCHPDAHLGQPEAGRLRRLPSSVEGFTPVRYSAELHAKTRYPLEGVYPGRGLQRLPPEDAEPGRADFARAPPRAEEEVLPRDLQPRRARLRQALDACESCHRDRPRRPVQSPLQHLPPGGELLQGQVRPRQGHQVPAHREASEGEVRHLPLRARAQQAGAVRAAGDRLLFLPRRPPTSASSPPRRGKPTDCEGCHTTDSFKAEKPCHQPPFTDYLLDGKHAKVLCEKCHPKVAVAKNVSAVCYQPLPRECEACHLTSTRAPSRTFVP